MSETKVRVINPVNVHIPSAKATNINGLRLECFDASGADVGEVMRDLGRQFNEWSKRSIGADVIRTKTHVLQKTLYLEERNVPGVHVLLWVWYAPRDLQGEAAILLLAVQRFCAAWKASGGSGKHEDWADVLAEADVLVTLSDELFLW